MKWASVLFSITNHALGFLKSKESRKYADRMISLEKKYVREVSKDEKYIDTNSIDHILIELLIISQAVTTLKE
jgi:hypothetical protein